MLRTPSNLYNLNIDCLILLLNFYTAKGSGSISNIAL